MFGVTDLFAFGIGCDLAGAILLGRGLLRSPRAIRRRATWGGTYPGGLIDDAEDRALATAGVWALLVGFGTQAVGYAVVLAVATSSAHSVGRAAVGVLVAAVPLVAIIVGEAATHHRRVDAILLRVGPEEALTGGRHPTPAIDEFVQIAEWRGWRADERLEGEDDRAYVERVFRVDATSWPGTWREEPQPQPAS